MSLSNYLGGLTSKRLFLQNEFMETKKPAHKSYAKPLSLELEGEIVGSQANQWGSFTASLMIRPEGQLPQLVEINSQVKIPLGPFIAPVRLMVERVYLKEDRKPE